MKIQIKNRYTGEVQFECELSAEHRNAPRSIQIGIAVKAAYKSDADLTGADLTRAVLIGCDLTGCDLTRAVLIGADLTGADLTRAVLIGCDLTGCDLTGCDLTRAVLIKASFCDAVLTNAVLPDADRIPKIKNIHQTVFAAASQPGALDMDLWHTCETTHCRAGWVVTLAGEGGKVLESLMGTSTAAALIYQASDPDLEKIPDFYSDNKTAMADMKRLAELEKPE